VCRINFFTDSPLWTHIWPRKIEITVFLKMFVLDVKPKFVIAFLCSGLSDVITCLHIASLTFLMHSKVCTYAGILKCAENVHGDSPTLPKFAHNSIIISCFVISVLSVIFNFKCTKFRTVWCNARAVICICMRITATY